MKIVRTLRSIGIVAGIVAISFAGYATRERWLPLLKSQPKSISNVETSETGTTTNKIVVNEQAQTNLGLIAKPLKPQIFWKTIQVPGMVVDRPGQSDRGVVATVTGVVSKVYHFPGDTVEPGQTLFTLKILSESFHLTQSELFKATQDITLAQAQKDRLETSTGLIPEARIIEVDNQITRLKVTVKAYRQELQNRGLGTDIIDGIANGKFVNEMSISVPLISSFSKSSELVDRALTSKTEQIFEPSPTFEVQDLKVDLGQQVQAGQTLCLIANHQKLEVEGRAFRDETMLLERSVKEGWPVDVDFQEETKDWGEIKQNFYIRHLANTIDPVNRTFAFRIPIENQLRVVEDGGRKQTLWRFRPGQKVRILVRTEKLDNVFVLPADAVASEGPEAFVFTQNVNTFTRKPVRVLLHDRHNVVLANDGVIPIGTYVVLTAGEQLNRMVKSGENSGVPKGYHIHADGSLHKNEEEGN
jgi:biotin carboxyl carrier protein